jgi:hypothetical protein
MRKILPIILFCLLISQIACSSDGKIRGRVYDMQNKPLNDAEVTFISFKQDKNGVTPGQKVVSRTNEKGEFELQSGKTQKDEKLGLVVTKEGYKKEIISLTVEELRNFKEIFLDYNIFLKKNE